MAFLVRILNYNLFVDFRMLPEADPFETVQPSYPPVHGDGTSTLTGLAQKSIRFLFCAILCALNVFA